MVWSIGMRTWGFRRRISEDVMMSPGEIYEFEHQVSGGIPAGQERAFLLYVKNELEKKNPYLKVNYVEYGSHVMLQAQLLPPPSGTTQALTVPWWAPILADVIKWLAVIFAAWAISQLIYNIYLVVSAFGPEGASAIGSIIALFLMLFFISMLMNFFRGFLEPLMPKREERKEK